MKYGFVALCLTMIAANCPTSPREGTSSLRVRFGESVAIDSSTRLTFADVEDSRCPRTVTCVWAGDAAVRLQAGTDVITLHTNSTAGSDTAQLNGLTIKLTDVQPERVSSEPPRKSDYVITLQLTR